jgi:hypothetical protein
MQARTIWEEKGMEKASRSFALRLLNKKVGPMGDRILTQIYSPFVESVLSC